MMLVAAVAVGVVLARRRLRRKRDDAASPPAAPDPDPDASAAAAAAAAALKRRETESLIDDFLREGPVELSHGARCDADTFRTLLETYANARGGSFGRPSAARPRWAWALEHLGRLGVVELPDGFLGNVRAVSSIPAGRSPPLSTAFLSDPERVTVHPLATCTFAELKQAFLAYARDNRVPMRETGLRLNAWLWREGLRRVSDGADGSNDVIHGLTTTPRWKPSWSLYLKSLL